MGLQKQGSQWTAWRPRADTMADESLIDKVHDLSDLELAALLSLIAREHCLISTPPAGLDDLVEELQLVARKTFGLTCTVVDCTPSTTLEAFTNGLLVPSATTPSTPLTHRNDSYFSPRSSYRQSYTAQGPPSVHIANVVLARNLHLAPHAVQIQALELLRTKRVFTRTAVHSAPKTFLFAPVLGAESGGEARVGRHLNDFFFLGHWHDIEDGYVNLEELSDDDDDTVSTGSVVKVKKPAERGEALISENEMNQLAKLSEEVEADVDIIRYQMNIVSFLRMHRAVADGISPRLRNIYSTCHGVSRPFIEWASLRQLWCVWRRGRCIYTGYESQFRSKSEACNGVAGWMQSKQYWMESV